MGSNKRSKLTSRTAKTASLDAAFEGPCKQREVNHSSAERGTTLEELQVREPEDSRSDDESNDKRWRTS